MANILLLGAGFSANWGAPVVSGFFNALIADEEIRANRPVHDLLWQNRSNFENALGELQRNFRQGNRELLLLMQRAITRIFERHNGNLAKREFELRGVERSRTVIEFLATFDAIFTLNQDLLLEIHYFDHAQNQFTSRKWNGGCVPGMAPIGPGEFGGPAWSGRVWTPSEDFKIHKNSQPFFKLHGSSNWKGAGDNADMMIMGGGKIEAINEIPVLRRYQEIFAEYAHRGKIRVTVIGYGFRDDHINRILKDGIESHGLQIYVIDPRGPGLAHDSRPLKEGDIGYGPTEFDAWFQKGLFSASAIPLRHLLAEESVESGVLADFLAGR